MLVNNQGANNYIRHELNLYKTSFRGARRGPDRKSVLLNKKKYVEETRLESWTLDPIYLMTYNFSDYLQQIMDK